MFTRSILKVFLGVFQQPAFLCDRKYSAQNGIGYNQIMTQIELIKIEDLPQGEFEVTLAVTRLRSTK
jgi:hypothetical protein